MVTVILVVISNPMDYFCVMLLTHVAIVSYLRDGLRDETSRNSEKIRDISITSWKNPSSLIKNIECNSCLVTILQSVPTEFNSGNWSILHAVW